MTNSERANAIIQSKRWQTAALKGIEDSTRSRPFPLRIGSSLGRILLRPSWLSRFLWRQRKSAPRAAQLVFAEAFALAHAEGLTLSQALELAIRVTPGKHFRRILGAMRQRALDGESLAGSLDNLPLRVHPGLRAALTIGENEGGLVEELLAFARRGESQPGRRFRRVIGRDECASTFAAALARRLKEGPLTVQAVCSAGQVASAGRRRPAKVMARLVDDLESGHSLADALARPSWRWNRWGLPVFRATFDPLFLAFVEAAQSREELRNCLARLSDCPESPRAAPRRLESHFRSDPTVRPPLFGMTS